MSYPRPTRKAPRSLHPQRDNRVKIYERDLKIVGWTVFFYTTIIVILSLL